MKDVRKPIKEVRSATCCSVPARPLAPVQFSRFALLCGVERQFVACRGAERRFALRSAASRRREAQVCAGKKYDGANRRFASERSTAPRFVAPSRVSLCEAPFCARANTWQDLSRHRAPLAALLHEILLQHNASLLAALRREVQFVGAKRAVKQKMNVCLPGLGPPLKGNAEGA